MLVKKIVTVGTLAICLHAEQLVLQDGTPIRLRLNRNVSSADAKVGETIDFELLDDIKVKEALVAKRGGIALATVTQAQEKRRMGKAGKLDINIDHLRLMNGEKAALRAIKEGKGGSNAGKMTGAIVVTSLLFFPAAPLFLFVKGKDITIPKGTEITAYVNGDITLDSAKFAMENQDAAKPTAQAAAVAAPAATGKALTNQDVIDLKSAGFGDEVIIAKIQSAPGKFNLETGDLLALQKAKVSDAIIAAMIQASKK